MLRKLLVLALACAIGIWGFIACDDGGGGDGDGDTDSDTDADGDSDWECDQPNTERPQLRITSLQISAPSQLATGVLPSIIAETIDSFQFVWLIEIDMAGNTMTIGSGRGVEPNPVADHFCEATWDAEYPGQTTSITADGDTISTSAPIGSLDIPMYSDAGEPLMTMPITQLEVTDVVLSGDRTLVGTPGSSSGTTRYASDWETAGNLRGWISVDGARGVEIEDLGQTLCALLTGDRGEAGNMDDDCTSPQEEWDHQPEEMPGGGQGFLLEGTIGAGAVTIGS
jgi:hypothetical protein